jgi:hypothetical protein
MNLQHEFSESYVSRADDGTVTLTWTQRGRTATSLVSDVLIEEWVETINENVRLKAELALGGA